MKITLCASVSAYKKVIEVMHELENVGYEVIVPPLALLMEQKNNFDSSHYVDEFSDEDVESKYRLIIDHFPSIEKANALMVVNEPKHGILGYVGPNVLMEMAIGLYLQKPLFLLNEPSKELHSYSEIMGMKPVVLKGNVAKIVAYLKSM